MCGGQVKTFISGLQGKYRAQIRFVVSQFCAKKEHHEDVEFKIRVGGAISYIMHIQPGVLWQDSSKGIILFIFERSSKNEQRNKTENFFCFIYRHFDFSYPHYISIKSTSLDNRYDRRSTQFLHPLF